MRPHRRPTRARLQGLAGTLLVAGAMIASPGETQAVRTARAVDGITPHINAVLYDPAVSRRIQDWGLTVADVQHDVDAMSPEDRARLAYVLTRRWRSNESHSQADLQAQFLVTMSLMRESTLFASIISNDTSRLR